MLANFLEKSKPINFVVYIGLFLIFFLVGLFTTLFNSNFTLETILKSIAFLSLFLLIFFFLNFIIKKNKLTFDNTFAYFLHTLFIVVFIEDILDYKSLFSILLYFLFLRKTYSLRTNKKTLQKLFDTGLWLGVLVIFQPITLLLLLIIYTAVLVYRTINIQTFLAPIIGFFVPLFLYFSYCFWIDETALFLEIFNFSQIDFNLNISLENNWLILFISILSIVAFLLKTPKIFSISNTFRMSWILININYLFIFILIVINGSSKELISLFLLFPASVIITNGIELVPKKTIQSIFLGIIILITIFGWWLL